MVDSVSGPKAAREILSVDFSIGKFVSDPCQSSIRFGKRDSSQFFDTLKNFFLMVFSWIKYKIFFFCFDSEEEQQNQLKNELSKYIDEYYEKCAVPSSENKKELRKDYKKLDSQIRELVEESIKEILKEAESELKEKDLNVFCKKILNDPFLKIKDDNKPQEQQEIQVMGHALWQASEKLEGYSKE
ncbi:MAG: hypothetical protein K1000chlam3_00117 [Chlamydiae bacterium]|nr:hypothetical protein [Chlamydiota bacterium]